MLDQLVESKSNTAENTRRSEFMVVVLVLAVLLVIGLWTKSLFAHQYDMGGDDLALTTLVAPVPVEDEPEPEKPKEPEKQVDADVRKELIANINQSPPKEIPPPSVEKNTKATMRDNFNVKICPTCEESNASAPAERGEGRVTGDSGGGNLTAAEAPKAETAADEGPPPKKAPPRTVSGGVLNGKATSLPKPAYPPAARAVRAGGACSVQVTISETGSVISASAASCHPLLASAAVAAARGARFSPTLLSGQAVKVTGVITYNFVP
jgi:protein TonB